MSLQLCKCVAEIAKVNASKVTLIAECAAAKATLAVKMSDAARRREEHMDKVRHGVRCAARWMAG